MVRSVEVLVIGAGPGGYPAAIRAAQLGKNVVIIDKGNIGGECLNWGCIPSKALIFASGLYSKMKNQSSKMGIMGGKNVTIDFKRMQRWKSSIQRRLINSIKHLLKEYDVDLIIGKAKFCNKNQVEIELNQGGIELVNFKHAIIATGAEFISIPGFEIDEINILSAKGALELEVIPDEFVIIGGGIIGLELGTVYAKLGSKVTIIELLPDLMTGVDPQLVKIVKKKFRQNNVKIYTEAKATGILKKENKMIINIEINNDKVEIIADKILIAVGKKALTSEIGLDEIGIKLDQMGFILTDPQQKTNILNIHAIGDCTGMPFLAHRATKHGIVAAEVIADDNYQKMFNYMPSVIFTDPEIAFVGLTEKEAIKKGYHIHISKSPFSISGNAMAQLETDGYIQLISNVADNKLLGVQIVGLHASDLISEAILALEMGATAEDIGFTVHPHPTLPELMMEAAEATLGKAIHLFNPSE